MILKNIHTASIQDLIFNDLKFKVVSDPLSVNLINLYAINGIIIRSDDSKIVQQILRELRIKNDPQLYLIPVFIDSSKLFKKFGNDVDGYFVNNISPISNQDYQSIKERILSIKNDQSNENDQSTKIIIKSLQFAYSRNKNLTPYRDRTSLVGYNIPFISLVTGGNELVGYINKLDKFSSKSFLDGTLVDKVNLCNSCLSSYLNFHETCSKCSSIDLKYENLIHHFRCAYIGPESDFKKADALVCPKCDKTLNHIGIDYDKPSEISSCNHCNHSSQETSMKAKCVDCGEHNDLAQLNTLNIKDYKLTTHGINWITDYSVEDKTDPEKLSDLSIVPATIFNLLVDQEKARVQNRKEISSYLGEIKINETVYAHLNEVYRLKLKMEVLEILKTYLRPIDILCAQSSGHYSFLLPDSKKPQAYELYLMILDNLNKILEDNTSSGQQLVSGDLKKI